MSILFQRSWFGGQLLKKRCSTFPGQHGLLAKGSTWNCTTEGNLAHVLIVTGTQLFSVDRRIPLTFVGQCRKPERHTLLFMGWGVQHRHQTAHSLGDHYWDSHTRLRRDDCTATGILLHAKHFARFLAEGSMGVSPRNSFADLHRYFAWQVLMVTRLFHFWCNIFEPCLQAQWFKRTFCIRSLCDTHEVIGWQVSG